MVFGGSNDPMWFVGQIAVLAVIGVLVWFGYKHINNGGRDDGIKVKV